MSNMKTVKEFANLWNISERRIKANDFNNNFKKVFSAPKGASFTPRKESVL